MATARVRTITIGQQQLRLDRLAVRTWASQLEGRFWGIAGVAALIAGFGVSFAISPAMLTLSGAFSDFGTSVRTAPYFISSLLFASFSIGRWRKFVANSLRQQQIMNFFLVLESVSLILIALMPYSWQPWPYRIHILAVAILGASITSTIVIDRMLRLPDKLMRGWWRSLNGLAFTAVIAGDLIIFSSNAVHWLDITLVGEMLLLSGYGAWIVIKTFAKVDSAYKVSSLFRSLQPAETASKTDYAALAENRQSA